MSILGQDGMGTPGGPAYSNTIGANVANGGMTPLAKNASGDSVALVDGAGPPARTQPKARPNYVLASWVYGTVAAAVASGSSFTYHTTMTVECSATRFRFAFMNINAVTSDIASGAIAVSNAVGSDVTFGATTGQARFTPSTGVWVPLTWNGGATSVTLPARISATVPSITWSDWIDIATIPRTDGGTLPVVMMRYYVASGNTYNIGFGQEFGQAVASRGNFGSIATTARNGRLYQSIRFTGDGVTTPANFAPTTDTGYAMVPGFEYCATRPGFTILADGDSITAGAGNFTGASLGTGFVWQAINLLRTSNPNTPIEMANIGVSASQTDTFLQRLTSYIAAGGHFDLAYYSPFSPNDGTPTEARIDSMMSRFAQAADAINAQRKPLVISTPLPNTSNGWDSTADAFRLALRRELLNSRYSGVPVVDFEILSDGATPARLLASGTTDGTHPNYAGHGVLAAPTAAAIAPLLGA